MFFQIARNNRGSYFLLGYWFPKSQLVANLRLSRQLVSVRDCCSGLLLATAAALLAPFLISFWGCSWDSWVLAVAAILLCKRQGNQEGDKLGRQCDCDCFQAMFFCGLQFLWWNTFVRISYLVLFGPCKTKSSLCQPFVHIAATLLEQKHRSLFTCPVFVISVWGLCRCTFLPRCCWLGLCDIVGLPDLNTELKVVGCTVWIGLNRFEFSLDFHHPFVSCAVLRFR